MSGNEVEHGFLKFLPKSGKPGVEFFLTTGKSYIGSSFDADIRLKIEAAKDIQCIVDVNKNGIATLLNKSSKHPVYVNSTKVEKFKVLHHEDKISILGKCFQYFNDKISKEDVDSFQTELYNAITTPSKKRTTIAAFNVQSTKKSPNLRTKTPSTRQTFETPDMRIIGDKKRPRTTSKLIVSKALGSPTSTRKRLSLDDNPKRANRVPKVSERNILLSEQTSSTILEEDSMPSLAREKVASATMDFLDVSNISVPSEDSSRREPLRRRSSMRTPSRSSVKPQTLTDRTNLTIPESPESLRKTPKNTPRKSSKLHQTPLTLTKIATPKDSTPGKILKNTPKKLLNTAKSETPKLYKSILVKKSLEPTRITSSKIANNSPSSSNVPSVVKKRPKSQGSVASSTISDIKRRKTEGNPSVATPKKCHTNGKKSITVDEGIEISVPLDPRLSLGKASPRKSVRVSQRLNGPSWQSSGIEDEEEDSGKEEDSDSSGKSEEKLNRTSSFSARSFTNNLVEDGEEGDSSREEYSNSSGNSEDKLINRTSSFSTQSFRNNLAEDGEDGDSSAECLGKSFDEETWNNFNTRLRESARQDEDEYLSRKSSMTDEEEDATEGSSLSEDEQTEGDIQESPSSSDADMKKARPQLRKSARRSDQMKNDVDMSDVKSIFVPQCRPPLRSSDAKQLSVSLQKSNTPQKISTPPNAPSRMSLRRSSTKSCKACGESPIITPKPRRSSTILSGNDSALSAWDQSIVTNNNSQSESDTSKVEYLELDSQRKRSLSRQSNKTPRNASVITIDDDSVKNTPENNTSIVMVDTPFEKPPRKLSKTLNSSIEDCVESSTPKSAIKGRRTKSAPYRPVVEEITPATPEEGRGKGETGFKTPLNTPGLFEDIKQSVLRSRSRRSMSSNLREELDKAAPSKAAKRARSSSTGCMEKSAKKRRVLGNDSFEISTDEEVDASFGSFETDEILTDEASDQEEIVFPNTPQDFKNLTDKPLITVPKTRSMTEPKKKRVPPKRLSLQAVNLRDQMTGSETGSATSPDNSDVVVSTVSSARSSRSSSRSFETKLVDKQKKNVKQPENDLTDVRGVKRLLRTPKPAKSPKNDLTNIVGVKKMFSTPNVVNSPKNDLTKVPNLRRLVYSVREKSPNNDLSDVAGIKRLLSTPKETKSPKNDLRNIPNLRRIMSPKQQNSPRNDLSDVAGLKKLLSTPKKQKEPRNDLRSVQGLKKLLSTPKKQKSPTNDLTKVPNLRRIMSPRRQNSPANDLRDVDGIADIFVESDIEKENNEDLFDKLFVRKPIRTYSGRSVSPITRKASVFGGQERKSVGDLPYSSPRIEKWLEDQAVVELERVDEGTKEEEPPRKTSRTRKRADTEETETEPIRKPMLRTRQVAVADESLVESPRRARQKRTLQKTESTATNHGEDDKSVSEVKVTRNRRRRASETEESNTVEEKKPARRTRRQASKKDNVESTDTESVAPPNRRGRARTVSVEKAVETTAPKRTNRRRGAQKKDEDEGGDTEMAPPPAKVDAKKMPMSDSESETSSVLTRSGRAKVADSSEELEPAKKRGRRKVAVKEIVELKDEGKEGMEVPNNKRKGTRRNQKPEPIPKEPEEMVELKEEDDEGVEVQNNKRKGTRRNQKTEPLPKKPDETVELKVEDEGVEVQTNKRKGTRRNQKREPVPEEPKETLELKEEDDEGVEVQNNKRKGTRRNQKPEPVPKEPDETVELKEEDDEGVEVKNNKRKGTRRNQKTDPVPGEPEKPASKGGRKKIAANNGQEPQDIDEEIVEVKTTKKKEPKGRKQATDVVPEETSTPVRSTRRQKVIVIEDSTDVEDDKENVNENANKKTQPKGRNVKASKSSRRKAVTEDPEDTPKDLPKTQIGKAKEAVLAPEDSPRTRQKKGNFRKYGEDFVTGTDNLKKVVRFDENGSEDGTKNNLKRKATEETLRRSKRTNK